MLDLDAWTLLATAGIILVGGTVTGLAGFGFGLIVVPALLAILPPGTVVAVLRMLDLATGSLVLAQDVGHVERRAVASLLPWASVGLAGGVLVLERVDPTGIRLLAGAAVVTFATLAVAGWRIPGLRSPRAPAVVGTTSGLLGTSVGMSGPPVVLLLTERRLVPVAFRATITAYFVLLDVVAIALLAWAGTLGRREVLLALALLPVAVVGRSIGRRLAAEVESEAFRRLTLGLLLLTGLSAVATAVLALR